MGPRLALMRSRKEGRPGTETFLGPPILPCYAHRHTATRANYQTLSFWLYSSKNALEPNQTPARQLQLRRRRHQALSRQLLIREVNSCRVVYMEP